MRKKILIVLCGGLETPEMPNKITKARYNKAYEIHNEYDYILVPSKGSYREDVVKNETLSEAEIGKIYLEGKGVNGNKILVETKSQDTFSNALYSRILL